MTNDADWVEDVRRWVAGNASSSKSLSVGDRPDGTDPMVVGYEAAHPALQARHWPEAMATGYGEL